MSIPPFNFARNPACRRKLSVAGALHGRCLYVGGLLPRAPSWLAPSWLAPSWLAPFGRIRPSSQRSVLAARFFRWGLLRRSGLLRGGLRPFQSALLGRRLLGSCVFFFGASLSWAWPPALSSSSSMAAVQVVARHLAFADLRLLEKQIDHLVLEQRCARSCAGGGGVLRGNNLTTSFAADPDISALPERSAGSFHCWLKPGRLPSDRSRTTAAPAAHGARRCGDNRPSPPRFRPSAPRPGSSACAASCSSCCQICSNSASTIDGGTSKS